MDGRQRDDEERDERQPEPAPTEDLDVPDQDTEDVKGGIATSDVNGDVVEPWSFRQAWPKKWSG